MLEDTKVGKKFSGIFKGQVIAHLPCGRCKVWVPDVYPEEFLEESSELKDVYGNNLKGAMLPDAEQASPLFGGGITGNGSFSYPKLNSYVWCMFEREDINHPVYFAAAIDVTDMSKTAKNSFIETTVNSESGKVLRHIIKCGKSKITFDENGTITLENDSMAFIKLGEGNTIEINAGTLTLNGNLIDLHANDGIVLNSETNIDINALNRFGSNNGNFILSTDRSCLIHDKEFNQNMYWGTGILRFYRGF